MEFDFYYNCRNQNLFEKCFERLNHLAHIIDDIVELGYKSKKEAIKEKKELINKYNLWEKLSKEKPKSWKEAREIQEKLGFFDDMVGTWTTVYVENKLANRYY